MLAVPIFIFSVQNECSKVHKVRQSKNVLCTCLLTFKVQNNERVIFLNIFDKLPLSSICIRDVHLCSECGVAVKKSVLWGNMQAIGG